MTWYKTGTVSVTNGSATVTGVGMDFVANAQVGEEFRLAGGQRGYEITAINSSTSLTIYPPFMDSTQSGASYVIVPTRGFANEARDAMRSILATLDDYLNGPLSGLFNGGSVGEPGIASKTDTSTGVYWPAPDQLAAATNGIQRLLLSSDALELNVPLRGSAVVASPNDTTAGRVQTVGYMGLGGYTVVAPDQDLNNINTGGLRHCDSSGVNKPSFASNFATLSLPRSATQGAQIAIALNASASQAARTAVRTRIDATTWTDWFEMYSQTSAVGTVSQSASGVPGGAIIERGSNLNGKYVRLLDGTQICVSREFSADVTTPQGGGFVSAELMWMFPAEFIEAPFMMADCTNNTSKIWGSARNDESGSETTRGYASLHGWLSTGSRTMRAVAIGRWV